MSKTLNNVQLQLDTRTSAQWGSLTRAIPKGYVCVELTTDGKCKLKVGDATNNFANLPYVGGDFDIANYSTTAQMTSAISTAVSTAISGLGTVFKLKGRKDTVGDLPASGSSGDIWLVGAAGATEFKEYYWTGTMWDFMGFTTSIDLSSYYTKTQIDSGFVAKVSGKALSTNDYTTAEKTKLAGIAAGATAVTVDSALSSTSTNAIQNKAVNTALAGKASTAAATTSAAGLMSATDKAKLDGIAASANNYTLPTASTTLGGVKTTSSVSSASGYTPTPIIGGVPYYKDTNTTYNAATTSAAGLMSAADKTKLDTNCLLDSDTLVLNCYIS